MNKSMTVDVLGTEYTIEVKKYDEEPDFKNQNIDGWCDGAIKSIVVLDFDTAEMYKGYTQESRDAMFRETLRHEIVHAFFRESGLTQSANTVSGSWARNEEMVDWFALQDPKIYAAWASVFALDSK